MSATSVAESYAPPVRVWISAARLQNGMLWLTGATGSLVFIEPSPYEFVSLATMLVFAATGLRLGRSILPLTFFLLLINVGYTISAVDVFDHPQPVVTWVLTSWYLAITAIFFAAVLQENTEARTNALVRGYMFAAAIAALGAIAGYFRLIPGASDILLEYSRARATFKDPNVLGAFMIFPTLIAIQRVMVARSIRAGLLVLLFGAGIFLSFSRAAWGQLVFTSVLMLGLMLLTTASTRQRTMIVVTTLAVIAIGAAMLLALLSFPTVADLFKERADLLQSYDTGAEGRFGRYIPGALLGLQHPLGIGPLQFATIFPEDTHNSYLNAFMSGGWLSGVCYVCFILLTLIYGFRFLFIAVPWRQIYIAVFAAFVGTAGESAIIDSDHWRHYFLLIGMLWGFVGALHRRPNGPPLG